MLTFSFSIILYALFASTYFSLVEEFFRNASCCFDVEFDFFRLLLLNSLGVGNINKYGRWGICIKLKMYVGDLID